jgi:hypothetical protein
MADASSQLEYAPTSPAQARQLRMRRYVVIAMAVALVCLGALLIPHYLHHAQVLFAQRQLLTATAPPTQVVYENDPVAAKKLLAAPTAYIAGPNGDAMLINNAWMSFYAPSGGGYQSSGTVFIGELRTKDGRPSLIGVDLSVTSLNAQHWASMSARAVTPGTTYRSPKPITTASRGDGSSIMYRPGDTLRVYAGQRDPNDPNHFTVDYVLNGTRHTVDGWLEDVGYVIMEQRD